MLKRLFRKRLNQNEELLKNIERYEQEKGKNKQKIRDFK